LGFVDNREKQKRLFVAMIVMIAEKITFECEKYEIKYRRPYN